MLTLLTALVTSGLILWYVKSTLAILFVFGAFCFSFTLLIFFHEMLHGLAFLLLGFKKISFFKHYPDKELFTFDSKTEKSSYFFNRK